MSVLVKSYFDLHSGAWCGILHVEVANMDTRYYWVPANNRTERPFKTKSGHTVLYMWNTMTGQHQYYLPRSDVFIENSALADYGLM